MLEDANFIAKMARYVESGKDAPGSCVTVSAEDLKRLLVLAKTSMRTPPPDRLGGVVRAALGMAETLSSPDVSAVDIGNAINCAYVIQVSLDEIMKLPEYRF